MSTEELQRQLEAELQNAQHCWQISRDQGYEKAGEFWLGCVDTLRHVLDLLAGRRGLPPAKPEEFSSPDW